MSDRPKRGRPQEREWPDPIDAEPEDIARAVLATPPKKRDEWRYLQEAEADG